MTRYRGVGRAWRGHRIVSRMVRDYIEEMCDKDPLFRLACERCGGWRPLSMVDDEGWLRFLEMVRRERERLVGEGDGGG